MSEDNDIARLLFWPVFIAGLGLILMLGHHSPGNHPLFSPFVRPSDREMVPLVGVLFFLVGGIQIVLVCFRWWRGNHPKR